MGSASGSDKSNPFTVAPKIFPVGTMSIIESPKFLLGHRTNLVIRLPHRQEPLKSVAFPVIRDESSCQRNLPVLPEPRRGPASTHPPDDMGSMRRRPRLMHEN